MASLFNGIRWIWKDGAFIRWEDATLHVMSHVVHYGSSVFEGIRFYDTPKGPSIFRLDDHIERFFDSAKIYRMEPGPSADELRHACHELLRRNDMVEGYIRPVAIRGIGAVGLDPSPSPVETYVVGWPWGAYLGSEALEVGVDACVSTWNRPAPNTFPTMSKAGGHYLNSQLMKMEAVANGYADAIALSPDGLVSEGSGQNLFLVKDGVLSTPQTDGTLLRGITRDCVLTLARDMGMEVREESVARERLYVADEMFFTGTAVEITPVRSVDRITVGAGEPGPITRAIQERYLTIARGQAPDSYGWCALPPSSAAKPRKVEVA